MHLQHILAVMKLKFIQEYLYPLLLLLYNKLTLDVYSFGLTRLF